MRASRRSRVVTLWTLPLLPRNSKAIVLPFDLDVAVAQRGQAEALVVARVLLVADADQRGLEQAHDGRQHLLARQAAAAQVGVDARADRRQRAAEREHAVELVRVAHARASAVVAVLLAAAGVAPGRLQVALARRADPDVGPGRRDRQHAQPPQLVRSSLIGRPCGSR